MNIKTIFSFILGISLPLISMGQALENILDPEYHIKKNRQAFISSWILHPDVIDNQHAVVLFRKSFDLQNIPERFIIHISADNRYRLFVNGIFASKGPAKSDLVHWYYETLDLSPLLKTGKNTLAVEVVNFGAKRTWSQFSARTDLFVQGHSENESLVNTTPGSWLTLHNQAFFPKIVEWINRKDISSGLYIANPMDSLIASAYPWGWEESEFDDKNWLPAEWSNNAGGRDTQYAGGINYPNGKLLMPRPTLLLNEELERLTACVQMDGIDAPSGFLKGKDDLIIPSNTKCRVLIDQTYLTIGYPELICSGGKGGQIRLGYAENLFEKDRISKGNRNETEGKIFIGVKDIFLTDGGLLRRFRSLSHRTFRFLNLEIETGSEPLTIHDFYNNHVAYPLSLKAEFSSGHQKIDALMMPGWRSVNVCAQDILLSDAYYEQMQYVGDSKVHNLAILYLSGNDDLVRNCLKQIDWSRTTDGLTLACYPNAFHLVIPFYSLVWIEMIHDYMMWSGDREFIRNFEYGITSVLNWFEGHMQQNNLLGPIEWWNDVDWSPGFPNGTPPGIEKGNSALFSLGYAIALQKSAQIYEFLGNPGKSGIQKQKAADIIEAVNSLCFDPESKIYAETPSFEHYSQHTNILAILGGAVQGEEALNLMNEILYNDSLSQVALFFRFYLFEALKKTGMADKILDELYPWHEMMEMGLTTFTEVPLNWTFQRSECHPWSTSPNIHFFSSICGIRPLKPGYESFEITPAFGFLKKIQAVFPHPECTIHLDLDKQGDRLKGTIDIQGDRKGKLLWNGNSLNLQPGMNTIDL